MPTIAPPQKKKAPKNRPDDGSGLICGWDSQVVLFNDDVNTFEHVIDCLMAVFGHGRQLAEKITLESLSLLTKNAMQALATMKEKVSEANKRTSLPQAVYCKEEVLPAMEALREVVDALEVIVDAAFWRFPTYNDLLYSVN